MVKETASIDRVNDGKRYAVTWQYIHKWEMRLVGMLLTSLLLAAFDTLLPGIIYGAKVIAALLMVGMAITAMVIHSSMTATWER